MLRATPFTDLMSIEHPIALAPMGGAAGALLGTRFLASREAIVPAAVSEAIVGGRGEDTERTRILDIACGSDWPAKYTARVLRNTFLDHWRGREEELTDDQETLRAYRQAIESDDLSNLSIWCSEAIDLINEIDSAVTLVHRLAADSAAALDIATGRTTTTR